MENLSQIDPAVRKPMVIDTPGHLMDHHYLGKPVLPAVEAMESLARAARGVAPRCRVTNIQGVRFDKFLYLDAEKEQIAAAAELHAPDAQALHAALITRTKSLKAAITRTKIHAKLTFNQSKPVFHPAPLDVAAAAQGICTYVDHERIYQELVPFGPAYRNILAPLCISPDGALAKIGTPDIEAHRSNLLGSPFALDAAFHAACVWSQRYMKVVAFPVAIDGRIVIKPTRPNRIYFSRILPRQQTPELMSFDIWLLDEEGQLCEMVQGVHMRDVSGGRLQPPGWIAQPARDDPLKNLRRHCQALSVIELDGVAPFASRIFTRREQHRFAKMGEKRRKSFLAGRLALKRLFRNYHDDDRHPLPQTIETVRRRDSRPCCRHERISSWRHCSLAHDSRFAAAVADTQPIGIDVERISDSALKSGRIYMGPEEAQLVAESTLGPLQAALRVWSAKEAVSKAMNLNLAEAWQQVRVGKIGERESHFSLFKQDQHMAWHAITDDHLWTLFKPKLSDF